MAIVISGVNNNDKITASDGTIDLLSGVNYVGVITAPAITSGNITSSNNLTAASINVGSNIQVGNAGIITATTLIGNVTGNINHTSNLLLQISGSEKLRIANSGAFGLNGTNYGSSGQVLTSQGSGSSPTWSTVSGTTINNQSDNRMITCTATSNTLNAEQYLTYTSQSSLNLTDGNGTSNLGGNYLLLKRSTANTNYINAPLANADLVISADENLLFHTVHTADYNSTERARINSSGQLLLGSASSANSGYKLESYSSGAYNIMAKSTNGNGGYHNFTGQASNGTITSYITHNGRGYFEDGVQFDSSGEVLNSYEEGSYTANFEVTSGSANFHNNTLHYVKIGSMCYVHGEIGTNSSSSAGGDLRFDLPFTSKASGSNMDGHARGLAGAIWNYYGSSNPHGNYGWYPLHVQINSNVSNNVTFQIVGYNGTNSNWGPIGNLIGSGAQIGISFTYRTA